MLVLAVRLPWFGFAWYLSLWLSTVMLLARVGWTLLAGVWRMCCGGARRNDASAFFDDEDEALASSFATRLDDAWVEDDERVPLRKSRLDEEEVEALDGFM